MKLKGTRESGSQRHWPGVVLLLILVLISIVNSGYRYFCDNHALQLPMVEKILDPDLFPHDPFVDTLADYESWVWWLVALLARAIDLKWVLLGFFLLTRTLLVYGCARVGGALLSNSPVAVLVSASLAALAPQSILGDGNLTAVYFEQTSLCVALLMLALAYLLKGKAARFWLVWALAFLVNPMYGIWSGLYFAGTWLADPERPTLGAMVKTSPIFIVLVTPIVIEGLRAFSQPKPDPDLWAWAIRLLNSPHLAPSTWPPILFRHFAYFVALVLIVGLVVRRPCRRVWLLTSVWAGLAMVFLALGLVVGRTNQWLEILVLQPARATDLFYLAAGVAIVGATAVLAVRERSPLSLMVFTGTFSATAWLLSPSFRNHALWPSLAIGVSMAAVLAFRRRRHPAERTAEELPPPMTAGRREWVGGPVLLTAALLFVLLLAMSGNLRERATRWGGGFARALSRGPDAQVAAIAEWARQETPAEAVFFHDPIQWEWAQFRYLSQRSVYATWKDASAVLWAPGYTEEWSDRFAAFGFRDQWRDHWDISQQDEITKMRASMRRRYKRLEPSDMRVMQREFDIDYWIAPRKAWSKHYPIVFRTEDFKVLQLDQVSPGSGQLAQFTGLESAAQCQEELGRRQGVMQGMVRLVGWQAQRLSGLGEVGREWFGVRRELPATVTESAEKLHGVDDSRARPDLALPRTSPPQEADIQLGVMHQQHAVHQPPQDLLQHLVQSRCLRELARQDVVNPDRRLRRLVSGPGPDEGVEPLAPVDDTLSNRHHPHRQDDVLLGIESGRFEVESPVDRGVPGWRGQREHGSSGLQPSRSSL